MTVETAANGALDPVLAFALVAGLGVGAQWVAWKLRLPAIVLMLAAGLIIGPGLGLFDPARDIGPLMQPIISIAVAIILFEGGMTLNRHTLREAAVGVRRLVIIGAPLGWLTSSLALHYVGGFSWESSAVFGGIMIVTGPTVIAPLLRQARLARRPAQLLQWEAIVNDPIGALAAVVAFEVVLVVNAAEAFGDAIWGLAVGVSVATGLGLAAGWAISESFRRGLVAEYMKVPVLFATLLMVFALSNSVLHESGLLAVTLMGIYVANSDLPSHTELRRFKEHATILLVSGVFILLAASVDMGQLTALDWRTAVLLVVIVAVVRPVTVLAALAFSDVPMRERVLVALTGPRGVVLVAVAGLFSARLVAAGVEDAGRLTILAFGLVAFTVVLHGFSLRPLGRLLNLAGVNIPGVIFVGGSQFASAFANALREYDVPVMVSDPNRARLRSAREAGLPIYIGDILGEGAERNVEFISFGQMVATSDNDAYNTLVATDLAPEFGRDNVFQLKRAKQEQKRHALPATLGGRAICAGWHYLEIARHMNEGWSVRATALSEAFTLENWQERNPEGVLLAELIPGRSLRILSEEATPRAAAGTHLIFLGPAKDDDHEAGEADKAEGATDKSDPPESQPSKEDSAATPDGTTDSRT